MLSFFLLSVAFALAPLSTVKFPVDRGDLRRYAVLFNDDAPLFGYNLTRLREWASQDLAAVDPAKIDNSWWIGNFTGFPAWLSKEGVDQLRQHRYIRRIAEANTIRLPPMETETSNAKNFSDVLKAPGLSRKTWGLRRIAGVTNNVLGSATNPTALFGPEPYAYPADADPTTVWDWTSTQTNQPNEGQNARIWIGDTGIRASHQEFCVDASCTATRIDYNVDCTNGASIDNNGIVSCPAASNSDDNGHGTHCAGTAAGLNRGVAPQARIGVIKMLPESLIGTDSTSIIAGINFVVQHKEAGKLNILSMSLGGPNPPDGSTDPANDASRAAWAAGIFVVVAAGNEGDNSLGYSPASASYPYAGGIVTVGATDANDYQVSFSNYGIATTILAPGYQVNSAWKDADTQYNTISGTSMATPHVAGAAAIIGTKFPNSWNSPNFVKNTLYFYARKGVVQQGTATGCNPVEPTTNRLLYTIYNPPPPPLDGDEEQWEE